ETVPLPLTTTWRSRTWRRTAKQRSSRRRRSMIGSDLFAFIFMFTVCRHICSLILLPRLDGSPSNHVQLHSNTQRYVFACMHVCGVCGVCVCVCVCVYVVF